MDERGVGSETEWRALVNDFDQWPFPGDQTYIHSTVVQAPRDEVLSFFSKVANLSRITPQANRLSVRSGDPDKKIVTGDSVLLEIQLPVGKILWDCHFPLAWNDDASGGFVDVMAKGPLKRWCHIHRFEEGSHPNETVMTDCVRWKLPVSRFTQLPVFQPIGETALRQLFAFRKKALKKIF